MAEKRTNIEKCHNPIVRRQIIRRLFPRGAEGIVFLCYMALGEKDYEASLVDVANKYNVTTEYVDKEITKILKKSRILSKNDVYLVRLRKEIREMSPLVDSFLGILGYNKELPGYTLLGIAILDGEGENRSIENVAELFNRPVDEVESEILEVLKGVDLTKNMGCMEGVLFLRNKLITPSNNLVNVLKREGLSDANKGFYYVATAVKLVMLGNNAKAFYGYELTSLYGRSLAPVRFQCEQTIGKIDSNATLEEFLKKICYD